MAVVKIVLHKVKRADGTFPVSLRVTKNRKTKYFKTIFNVFPEEWDASAELFNKRHANHLQDNRLLLKFKERAFRIYSELQLKNESFRLSEFENAFRVTSNPESKKIFCFWSDLIQEFNSAGRTGNARIHNEAFLALKKFNLSTRLEFEDITVTYLSKFETHLRSQGGNDGGISLRMRTIRAVFNKAIARDIIPANIYPFKNYKISKLKSKPAKRALDFTEIMRIVKMDISKHPHLLHSHKYFVFSFYTRGMNFADQINLKWSQINGDKIFYTRSKSKGNFNITILPPVRDILNYFKARSIGTKYVFPLLLQDNMTPLQIENRKHKTLSKYNKDLKEIATICNIDKTLTSYVARHSFANSLKQMGVATDIISESLGHQNLTITQAYLKELDSSVLDAASELLL
ncbi:Site-specific recombinase XerD [Salegentibacter agarivorans]|uniref:Site-specific recombinase XerD n=1 Tax=Salegentibacter agarivorans TaxID=345907 RepID=A0A1I2K6K2_9FLAO|nr:site-specific integrase [Salegentibacter agarivorans]SFF61969.1 Site-specific recombinase XerD [Salegentibacter agarivorans]